MLAKLSVKKPFTVLVAVLLVIILGVVAFLRMTPDLLPYIDLPYVIVATSYVGASPEEVENTITKPVEQAMSTLDNIKSVSSTSGENFSVVMMEFSSDANMDATTMNIREQLDVLSQDWNDYVGMPTILKINPNMIPLSAIAVDYEGMDTLELSRFYEDTILPRLEGAEGVASIRASGLIEQKINVVLQQDKMDAVNEKIRLGVDKEFEEGEETIADAQEELDDGAEAVAKGEKQIKSGKSQLNKAQKELDSQTSSARSTLSKNESDLKQALSLLNTAKSALPNLNDGIAQYAAGISQAEAGVSQAEGALAALEAPLDPSDPDNPDATVGTPEQIAAAREGVAVAKAARDKLESERDELIGQRDQILGGLSKIGVSDPSGIDAMIATVQGGIAQVEDGYAELERQSAEAAAQISSGKSKIRSSEKKLVESKEQLTDAQEELDDAKEELSDAKQQAYDATDLNNLLSLSTIGAILGAENFSMPAGYAADATSDTEWLVYVGDKFESVEELNDLILFDLGLEGVEPIYLTDVADVFVSDNSDSTYAKINGRNGVLLSFNKQSGYATATVSDNIRSEMDAMEAEFPGLTFSALMDQGEYIKVVIGSILENIAVGAVLAVIILLIFLADIRPTFIVACSIPISVTFAIVLMYFSGVSINVISMAGLCVGVGMLVDNSIVVIENIYRLRRSGESAIRSAVSGTVQMAGAITSSTLTTVCVFVPIVFVEGITRQLFTDMALTIAYSLLASLIVALTLVPAMASGTLRRIRAPKKESRHTVLRGYESVLRFCLKNKGLALILSVLLLTVCAYALIGRGFIYLPDMDSPQMTVTVTMPENATFDEAVAMTDEIAARLHTLPEVETTGAMFATGLTSMFGVSSSETDVSQTMVYVVLKTQDDILGYVPESRRGRASTALGPVIEQLCADLDCTVAATGAGNMAEYADALGGSGVTIELYGNDLDQLQATARELSARLAAVDGLVNINDGLEDTTPALRVIVDKQKAMLEGLTVAQVYQNIALALTADATVSTIEDSNSDIVIRMQEQDPTVTDIRERILTFTTQDGSYKKVALKDIATFSESETLQSIGRNEQRRYMTISAEIAAGHNVTLVTADAQAALKDFPLPSGMSIEFTGENETIMSALRDLGLMLLLGVVLVYLIMVAQFQSLLSPFIVMMTIPLAFTGGLIALLMCGMELSIMAMIGFIMLVGIIVNNGIVLIDTMNRLRQDGLDRREAIVSACTIRMRPVLMTALTTILGLVPMAMGLGIGGGLIQPIAIVCIGGLTYATLMTLFVVPIMYDILVKRPPRKVSKEDLAIIEEEELE